MMVTGNYTIPSIPYYNYYNENELNRSDRNQNIKYALLLILNIAVEAHNLAVVQQLVDSENYYNNSSSKYLFECNNKEIKNTRILFNVVEQLIKYRKNNERIIE